MIIHTNSDHFSCTAPKQHDNNLIYDTFTILVLKQKSITEVFDLISISPINKNIIITIFSRDSI